jgi:hypothetical protein
MQALRLFCRCSLEVAKRVAEGSITPEIEVLRLRLEKATSVPIAELAKHAAAWPV